ncbi:MAG TPA: M23 family metallopeptidase [Thermoanaerobaculia bacterium]|nr:M23 family metallopeptidase [Thermoanaerobaculia bacterium]
MIEIQLHPGNLRNGVRHILIGRAGLLLFILAGSLLLLFLLASMAAAPSVIRRAYGREHLREVRQEKAVNSQRLTAHVQQMLALEKLVDEQRIKVEKLVTVYGLEPGNAAEGGRTLEGGAAQGNDDLTDAHRREHELRGSLARLNRQVQLLSSFEAQNVEMIRHTPAILPIPGDQFVLTHGFGWRISPFTRTSDFHAGLDFAAPTGTAIHAAADGVVAFAGRYPMRSSVDWWRFGNMVVIRHSDRFITLYGHCDEVRVKTGDRVRQGEVVGTVGSSGWSTNSHLHYEVRTDLDSPGTYRPVDPQIYILDYQWDDQAALLNRARDEGRDVRFHPLPSGFLAKR